MTDPASAAFLRFVDALNHARDEARLHAAVSDGVRLERHAPGERGTAPIVEIFEGIAAVIRWFARTPLVVQFSLAGAPALEADGAWRIAYAIDAGEFHNGGIWLARLASDGRIAFLSHHPFALRDPR